MLIYETIVESLLNCFPEIKAQFDEESNWLSKDLAYVVFGVLFNPYLEELLRKHEHEQIVDIVFDFLEDMANSEDKAVVDLLEVEVLESLVVERDIVDKAKSLMRNKTLDLFLTMERACGW